MVAELADGSSMPGAKALEAGLIDKLGGRKAAQESIALILEKEIDDIVFCEYKNNPFVF